MWGQEFIYLDGNILRMLGPPLPHSCLIICSSKGHNYLKSNLRTNEKILAGIFV